MPAYQNSALQTPQLLQKGVPAYLFGAFSQQRGNTLLGLSTDAIATNVATVTAQLVNGPLPNVGDLVSIINAANSAGAFNVNRAPLTAVSYVASTNVMTLTFALTGTNQGATADGGTVIVEPAEVPETLANNTASVACVIQAPQGDSQYTVPVAVTFPTMPTAVTVTLQRALKNENAEYTNDTGGVVTVAAGAYTAGPVVEATLERAYLYRFMVTGLTGSGTVIAKVG
jgi:hypothetical protein